MKKLLTHVGLLAGFAALSTVALAQNDAPSSKPADNTAMNARDRSGDTTTPIDQPNNKTDITLAANVRSAIVGDKALSTKAHNVKLVAANGVVTLRGPVETAQEKMRVAELAHGVSGVSNVNNQLDIVNSSKE